MARANLPAWSAHASRAARPGEAKALANHQEAIAILEGRCDPDNIDTSVTLSNRKVSAPKRPQPLGQLHVPDTLTLPERVKEGSTSSSGLRLVTRTSPGKVSGRQGSRKPSANRQAPPPQSVSEVSIPDTLVPKQALLQEILVQTRAYIRRFVAATPEQYVILALWAAHTYVAEHFQQTAYLWIHSPVRQSGKTRLLEVLESVVCRAWLVGRITIPALVRGIEAKQRPTLLLDELDQSMRASTEYRFSMAQLLNDSCRRGRKAFLCVRGSGDDHEIGEFDVYCPKVLAGLSGENQTLPDTVEDRSIPIRMERRKNQRIERFREREKGTGEEIRSAWSEFFTPEVTDWLAVADPEMPSDLSDRAQDACLGLVALADLAGGSWSSAVRSSLAMLLQRDPEADGDLRLQLLNDIRDVLGKDEFVTSEKLVARLRKLPDRPWKADVNGRELSTHRLARTLGDFAIKPQVNGSMQKRGYLRRDFERVFAAYLQQLPQKR